MEQSVFEHVGQQVDDTTHTATQTASAFADALEVSFLAAQRSARDAAEAATELFYNAKRRLQRHPFDSFALTLAAGVAAGAVIGWVLKSRMSQKQGA